MAILEVASVEDVVSADVMLVELEVLSAPDETFNFEVADLVVALARDMAALDHQMHLHRVLSASLLIVTNPAVTSLKDIHLGMLLGVAHLLLRVAHLLLGVTHLLLRVAHLLLRVAHLLLRIAHLLLLGIAHLLLRRILSLGRILTLGRVLALGRILTLRRILSLRRILTLGRILSLRRVLSRLLHGLHGLHRLHRLLRRNPYGSGRLTVGGNET